MKKNNGFYIGFLLFGFQVIIGEKYREYKIKENIYMAKRSFRSRKHKKSSKKSFKHWLTNLYKPFQTKKNRRMRGG